VQTATCALLAIRHGFRNSFGQPLTVSPFFRQRRLSTFFGWHFAAPWCQQPVPKKPANLGWGDAEPWRCPSPGLFTFEAVASTRSAQQKLLQGTVPWACPETYQVGIAGVRGAWASSSAGRFATGRKKDKKDASDLPSKMTSIVGGQQPNFIIHPPPERCSYD
jgi:hypothetical protein